jgi:hypothetical protein
MNDQQIMDYWYKHLYKNYPFIQWKVEVEADQTIQFHPILLKITGMNLVCKIANAMMQHCQDCNKRDRNFILQNKMIAREIKVLVKDLKARSSQKLKQDIP